MATAACHGLLGLLLLYVACHGLLLCLEMMDCSFYYDGLLLFIMMNCFFDYDDLLLHGTAATRLVVVACIYALITKEILRLR
jgi:hypothetical protein